MNSTAFNNIFMISTTVKQQQLLMNKIKKDH
jgi:hypothetical protein